MIVWKRSYIFDFWEFTCTAYVNVIDTDGSLEHDIIEWHNAGGLPQDNALTT